MGQKEEPQEASQEKESVKNTKMKKFGDSFEDVDQHRLRLILGAGGIHVKFSKNDRMVLHRIPETIPEHYKVVGFIVPQKNTEINRFAAKENLNLELNGFKPVEPPVGLGEPTSDAELVRFTPSPFRTSPTVPRDLETPF